MVEVASGRDDARLLGLIGIGFVFVETIEGVGAIGLGLFFGLGAELLIVELAKLSAEEFVFVLEFGEALEGSFVTIFPVPRLLSEFEVVPLDGCEVGLELYELRTQ